MKGNSTHYVVRQNNILLGDLDAVCKVLLRHQHLNPVHVLQLWTHTATRPPCNRSTLLRLRRMADMSMRVTVRARYEL